MAHLAARSIFIAHDRRDAAHARALADAITAAGGAPWLDATHLDYGDPIGEGIIAGLRGATLVAALITRAPDRQSWCLPEEVARAIDRLRETGLGRVVPVLYDAAPPDALPYGLYRLKALPVARDTWAAAAAELVRVAGGAPRPIDEPPPTDVPRAHVAALTAWLDDVAHRFDDVPGLTPTASGRCLSTLFVRLDQRALDGGGREALMGRGLRGPGRPLDDLLRADPKGRWTLQGDPGAGKTTQLRHLAMDRAREALAELESGRLGPARVPIFAALSVLDLRLSARPDADAVTVAVEDHAARALTRHPAAALEAALRWAITAGKALVLLDGFDEVRPESVAAVRAHIALIERRCAETCLVVTSRRFGYVSPNDQFGELEILPLSPTRQRELLAHWDLPAARVDGIMAQVAGRPALQEMAGNPFVLTLMALLARESDAPLPTRRVALYRAVLGLLVRGRLGGAPGPARTGLGPDDLRIALGELALALLQDHAGPWTADELDHHLRGLPATGPLFESLDDVPLALEADTGLLVALDRRFDRRRTGWRFLHRSLMECLAAEALHRRGDAAARKFAVRLAGGKWYAPWTWGRDEQVGRWAEVYCHLAAMMREPQVFLRGIAEVHPRLAMRALMSLDAVPVADLLGDEIDLRAADLALVRLLIEAVPDRAALARAFVRLAEANRQNGEALALIAAGLVAIGREDTLPAVARAVGGWARLGVPQAAWAEIPAGEYVMGSPDDEEWRFDWEGPQRRVRLDGFEMGTTPVTQALYAVVTGRNPSRFTGDGRRPVEQVSWDDAVAFCAALGVLQERHVRLPTEAEWEYACRAGTTTATYAGPLRILGANNAPALDAIAWYGGNSGSEHPEAYDASSLVEPQYAHKRAASQRVGQKRPNGWGLYDMLGNVWEWCQDEVHVVEAPAPGEAPLVPPAGPAAGSDRVIRGGAWDSDARWCRSAFRNWGAPGGRDVGLGFRLVRAPRAPRP